MQGGKDLQHHVENYFSDPTIEDFIFYIHEQKKWGIGSEYYKKRMEL